MIPKTYGHRRIMRGQPPQFTFAEAFKLYRKAGGKISWCQPVLAAFGDIPIDQLTQSQFDVEAHRRYAGAKPSTVRRQFFVPLSAVVNFAAGRGLCRVLSIKGPPQKRLGSKLILHPSDAQRIADACAPHFRPLFLFLYLSGANAGEVVTLDWKQIDVTRRQVRMRKSQRELPLHPHLFEALLTLTHRVGRVFLCPNGKPYVDRGNGGASIRDAFGRACKQAGVSPLCVRDLRTSWAALDFAVHRDIGKTLYRGGWAEESSLRWLKRLPDDQLKDLSQANMLWGQSESQATREEEQQMRPSGAATPKVTTSDWKLVFAWPRLLKEQDAARYCSLSVDRFRSICPVPVIRLGQSGRLERYDRLAIDEWIDKLTKSGDSSRSDWLGLVESRHARSTRQGTEEGAREGAHLLVSSRFNDEAQS